jgi:hypothetical protein
MHPQAYIFVARGLERLNIADDAKILEIGAYNVNGSARDLLDASADYTGLDVRPGPGVDIVSDCAAYDGDQQYDLVISTETLEHMTDPKTLIDCAEKALKMGGGLILTCASPERVPHGINGGVVGAEHYKGITPERLRRWLSDWDDARVEHHSERGDLYATARKPKRRSAKEGV